MSALALTLPPVGFSVGQETKQSQQLETGKKDTGEAGRGFRRHDTEVLADDIGPSLESNFQMLSYRDKPAFVHGPPYVSSSRSKPRTNPRTPRPCYI